MRIYQHFSIVGFCNTYLVAHKRSGSALLVDPGTVDNELINLIEMNGYTLEHILLTHAHLAHHEGVGTLRKIYNFTIWASSYSRYDLPFTPLDDGERLELCGLEIRAIHLPGHSLDSLAYVIDDHALFSGDSMHCGRVGGTRGYQEREVLLTSLKHKILTLDENTLLFPGHGAPSKLRIERLFNRDLREAVAQH
jgi:hydroxyacylglutathione hydrolase